MSVFETLRKKYLYINEKKCSFPTITITFIGFVVSIDCVCQHQSKVATILQLLTPKSIHDVWSFH